MPFAWPTLSARDLAPLFIAVTTEPSQLINCRALELVSAYESAQRNLQSEVEFLRAEVRRLSSELASAQNTISAKDSFGSWRTSDEGELLRRLAEAKKAADQAADDARRQLGMAAAKLRAAHTALAEARADAQQQRVRADNLQAEVASHAELASRSLEAASRSGAASTSRHEMALSSAATAAAAATAAEQQARASADLLRQELAGTGAALHRTTARLHESERRAAAAEEAAAKAAAVAASAGARDRAIVTEACHALRLVDGSQLPAAVRKLAAALSALPQMERWVREVCAITSAAAAGRVPNAADRGPPLSAGLTPERTLGELRKWAASKRELNHLREFAASLSADLAPVSQHKPAAGSHGVQGASNATGERVASPPTLGDLSAAVKSLVAAQLHNSPASTRDGRIDHRCKIVSTSGADEPETLTASPPSQPVGGRVAACAESHNASDPGLILAHFMRLFDVSSQEGVLPKANELFLFVQEQHTFLRVLRASLGESADAPPRALLQAVDKMVERARSARVSPKDSRSRDDSAPRLARDVVEELADANSLAPPTRPPPGHRPPPFAGVSGGEYMGSHANIETVAHPAEGEAKTAASAAADENRRLLDELCSLLDVSMNVELLPKVKDLLGHAHTLMRLLRVAQPDELVPALRAMIQQLRDETAELDEADQLITAVCDMLEVRSAHQVLPTLTLLLQESVVARSGPPASVVAADAYPLPQGATDLGSIASAAIEQSVAAPNGGITLPRDADNSSRACGYAPTSSNGPLSPRSMQLSMADASASRPAPFVDGHAAVGRSADAAPLSPMDGILGTTAKLKLGAYTSATSGDADAVPAPAVGTSALGTTPDEIVVLAIPGESSTAFAVDLATAADSLPELASSGKTFSATDLLTSDVTSGVFDGHAAEALQAVMPLLEKDFADYDDEEVKILDEYSSDDSILGAGYDEE